MSTFCAKCRISLLCLQKHYLSFIKHLQVGNFHSFRYYGIGTYTEGLGLISSRFYTLFVNEITKFPLLSVEISLPFVKYITVGDVYSLGIIKKAYFDIQLV